MKERCLVVGSNSFIGSNLISKLKLTYDVTGIYHKNQEKLDLSIANFPISRLNDLDSNYDVVYIISAYIPKHTINDDIRQALFDTNVLLVSKICSKYRSSKVVLCSSVSVYKKTTKTIYENSDEGGLNEYGVSKLWAERIVNNLESFSIVRLSSVYGPGMHANTVIPLYVEQALLNRKIQIWGTGKRLQNYIHVSDAVNYLIKAAKLDDSGVFLAVSNLSTSNRDLGNMIAELTGGEVVFEGTDNEPSFIYNNQESVLALKYNSQIDLKEGIEQFIKWRKEQF